MGIAPVNTGVVSDESAQHVPALAPEAGSEEPARTAPATVLWERIRLSIGITYTTEPEQRHRIPARRWLYGRYSGLAATTEYQSSGGPVNQEV